MSTNHIKESVERVINHYTENPDDARGPGAPITAVMEEGLRCRVQKQDGTAIITTDMSTGIGGGGSAPSPGLIFRAALASCDATFIALRAAQVGIEITTLEVTVEGDPDDISTIILNRATPLVSSIIDRNRHQIEMLEGIEKWLKQR